MAPISLIPPRVRLLEAKPWRAPQAWLGRWGRFSNGALGFLLALRPRPAAQPRAERPGPPGDCHGNPRGRSGEGAARGGCVGGERPPPPASAAASCSAGLGERRWSRAPRSRTALLAPRPATPSPKRRWVCGAAWSPTRLSWPTRRARLLPSGLARSGQESRREGLQSADGRRPASGRGALRSPAAGRGSSAG